MAWRQYGAASGASRRVYGGGSSNDDGGGGLFGTGIGPDVNLGVGTLFKQIGGIIPGLRDLGASLAPGGSKSMLPQFGKALAGSMAGTGIGILDPTGKLARLAEEQVFGGEENFDLRTPWESINEDGVIPGLIEHVGNVSLVGGVASQALKAGRVGAAASALSAGELASRGALTSAEAAGRATGLFGRGARAVEALGGTEAALASPAVQKAMRAQMAATKIAHPYRMSYNRVLKPILRHGPALEKAAHTAAAAGRVEDAAEAANKTVRQGVMEAAPGEEAVRLNTGEMANESSLARASRVAAEAETAKQVIEDERLRTADLAGVKNPNDTVTLYRGEGSAETAGEVAEPGAWYTDQPTVATAYAGTGGPESVRQIEVPREVAEKWVAGGTADETGAVGRQYKVPEHWRGGTPDPDEVKAGTDMVTALNRAEVEGAVSEAKRANGTETASTGLERVGQELQAAAAAGEPEWVAKLWDKLPGSMQTALTAGGRKFSGFETKRLVKDMHRLLEGSQRQARHGNLRHASNAAAQFLAPFIDDVPRARLSQIIGEEIGKIADGTSIVRESVASKLAGIDLPVEAEARLMEKAVRGYGGVTEEMRAQVLAKGGQEAVDEMDRLIEVGVQQYKAQAALTFKQMLRNRPGARGLEAQLMENFLGGWTPEARKAFKGAMRELNREKAMLASPAVRHERELADRQLVREHTVLGGLAERDERMVRQGGHQHRDMDSLNEVRGAGMRTEVRTRRTAGDIVSGTNTHGGHLEDVSSGTAVVGRNLGGNAQGWLVRLDVVDRVPAAEWAARGEEIIYEALMKNRNRLAHPDARLGTTVDANGDVVVDISQHSVNGRAMSRAEAWLLGLSNHESSIVDLGTGAKRTLANYDRDQSLAARLVTDGALKEGSGFLRFADELERSLAGFEHDRIEAVMAFNMVGAHWLRDAGQTMDEWFQQTHIRMAERASRDPLSLREDLLKGHSVFYTPPKGGGKPHPILGKSKMNHANFVKILQASEQYQRMMPWYRESHDAIEAIFGEDPHRPGERWILPMAYGEPRAVTDIMYDAMAILSTQQTPQMNLGFAMQALANQFEFIQAHGDGWMDEMRGLVEEIYQMPGQRASTWDPKTKKQVRRGPSVRYIESRINKLGKGTHPYRDQRAALVDVLTGKIRLDTMTHEDIIDFNRRWFGQERVYDIESALADPRVQALIEERNALPEQYRNMLGGPEEYAIMEAFGGSLWAKYRSFRQNLANPDDPMPVTADMWVARGHHPTRSDKAQWGGRTMTAKGQKIYTPTRRMDNPRFEKPPVNMMDVIEWNNQYRQMADQISSVHGTDRAGLQHAIQAVHWAVFMDVFDRAKAILQGEKPVGFTPAKGYNFAEVLAHGASKATTVAIDQMEMMGIPLRDRFNMAGLPNVSEGEDVVQRVRPTGGPAENPAQWHANAKYFEERAGAGGTTIPADPETGTLYNPRTGDYELREERGVQRKRVTASTNEDTGTSSFGPAREVSVEEYDALAARGDELLQARREAGGPGTFGDDWDGIINQAYERAQQEWGGATIDAHTGAMVADDADQFAVTVRAPGEETISLPLDATPEQFAEAAAQAREAFSDTLSLDGGHLGIFRNETTGAIEFDPVLVLNTTDEVETIGAATAAQGGAYHFKSGDGYWVPYVADEVVEGVNEAVSDIYDATGQYVANMVLGETVPMNEAGHLMMRFFNGADFGTLMHENAHVLSLLLSGNDDLIRRMSEAFGVPDVRKLTPGTESWVNFQERFAESLVKYFHNAPDGRIAQNPALKPIFAQISNGLRVMYDEARFAFDLPPAVEELFDNLFNPDVGMPPGYSALDQMLPEIADPSTEGTLAQKAQRVRRNPNESDASFAKRARKAGQIVEREKTIAAERSKIALRKAQVEANIRSLEDTLAKHTGPREAEALRIGASGRKKLDKLGKKLGESEKPPAAWQPMVDALDGLRKEAEADETGAIAAALGDLVEGNLLDKALTLAAERGFTPTHIHDATLERAQSLLFGQMQLGRFGAIDEETVSGLRRSRTGALHRAGMADRSVESLLSAHMEVAREHRGGQIVDHIEQNLASPIAQGDRIPDGYEAWDPMRQFVLTGSTRASDGLEATAGPGTRMIIPKAVGDALRHMSKNYDSWPFRMLRKGTSFWRNWMLTLSPRWYMNNFMGNTILATKEGVRLQDWLAAFQDFRKRDVLGSQVRLASAPELTNRSYISEFDQPSSVIDVPGDTRRERLRRVKETEGGRAARAYLKDSVSRINTNFDEIARSAVMNRHLRNGATRADALERAQTALVNYGDLGPLERSIVRSVVPFYAWQKGILKLVAKFPSDNPVASALLIKLGDLNNELLEDRLGGPVPSAYAGGLAAGPFAIPRGLNPFVDAGSLVDPNLMADNVTPFADLLVRDAYNAPEGYPESYRMGAFGQKVPEVNALTGSTDIFSGLPQVRLGQQAFGGGDAYGQDPGVTAAIQRFLGGGRTYTEEEIRRIMDRVAETQESLQ